jgi:HrpA-like RNA helicase
MPLPTLLVKGNLKATKWSPPQSELDDIVPIDYIMDWFDKRTPKSYGASTHADSVADRILIVHSSTGSGKSTLMPAELFHRFYDRTRKNIAITQPRRLTAMDIPKNQIAPFNTAEKLKEIGKSTRIPLKMGDNIGFQTGSETRRPIRGLIFMTVGIIMQQMNIMSDEDFMNKYSHIIIDEAHERSTDTDTALFSLKKFIERNYKNSQCPFLIVTSATFDAEKYANYLLNSIPKKERHDNIIYVKGLTYPIEEHFLDYDSSNYLQSAVDTVTKIHVEHPDDFMSEKEAADLRKEHPELFREPEGDRKRKGGGDRDTTFRDIIIFVSGGGEASKLVKSVEMLNSRHPYFIKFPVMPIQLTGDVVEAQSADYRNLFADIGKLKVEIRNRDKKTGKFKVSYKCCRNRHYH